MGRAGQGDKGAGGGATGRRGDGATGRASASSNLLISLSPRRQVAPSPTPSLLRPAQDALLENQRAAGIGPHFTGRSARDLFRIAPTHLHQLLGHSGIDLPPLDRRPYFRPPFPS